MSVMNTSGCESSRQQGVPHGKTERRMLGAPLRVEKRTLYKLIGGMHNDLLASNQGGRFDWTVQVGYRLPLTESGERRGAQEKAIRLTTGFLQKKQQRSTPILGLDLHSGLGMKGIE